MKTFYPEGWQTMNTYPTKGYTENHLNEAVYSGEILEAGALMCDNEHNLIVDLGSMKGVIPRDEGALGISDGSVRDIALISRVGKPVMFTVSSFSVDKGGKKYASLSRKSAQQRCRKEYISRLTAGDIINAKVTHLEPFGAFCDIGCGIIALLPIDSISVSRIAHPSNRLSVGQNIHAVVKDISHAGRVTLSLKELLGTWEENAALFSQGQTVTGTVRSVEDYGIFIELTPNLAGLAEPKDGITAGSQASVYIKSIIPEKMKVKLIIIDNFKSVYTPELNYFIKSGRIDSWQYSPDSCFKKITSEFGLTP